MGEYDIFNVGVRVTVYGCVGAALAVNVEAVEGRNRSNDCALNRSRCFTSFYFICSLLP